MRKSKRNLNIFFSLNRPLTLQQKFMLIFESTVSNYHSIIPPYSNHELYASLKFSRPWNFSPIKKVGESIWQLVISSLKPSRQDIWHLGQNFQQLKGVGGRVDGYSFKYSFEFAVLISHHFQYWATKSSSASAGVTA